MTDVTRSLNTIEQGGARAADELVHLAYKELRVPKESQEITAGKPAGAYIQSKSK